MKSLRTAVLEGRIRQYNHRICPGSFEVMLVVWSEAFDGKFSKGVDFIQRRVGYSRTKVFKILRELERSGQLIHKGKNSEGFAVYKIDEPGPEF